VFYKLLRKNSGLYVKFANLERIIFFVFCLMEDVRACYIYIHTSLLSFNLERTEQGRVR